MGSFSTSGAILHWPNAFELHSFVPAILSHFLFGLPIDFSKWLQSSLTVLSLCKVTVKNQSTQRKTSLDNYRLSCLLETVAPLFGPIFTFCPKVVIVLKEWGNIRAKINDLFWLFFQLGEKKFGFAKVKKTWNRKTLKQMQGLPRFIV